MTPSHTKSHSTIATNQTFSPGPQQASQKASGAGSWTVDYGFGGRDVRLPGNAKRFSWALAKTASIKEMFLSKIFVDYFFPATARA
ncbi:hypothetical protein Ct61P_03867 [Colletotrichum tofieldiae]|nr:hypothetical protein Ct61P_03867 [Colletotrichum tofieldiae]